MGEIDTNGLLTMIALLRETSMSVVIYSPLAQWGTQQMLTPPSRGAKQAVASARVSDLAKPKSDKQENTGV